MDTDPRQYLWPGIIVAQAIHAAARLGIPDLLSSGPKTAAALAIECGAHAPTLERLLRALVAFGILAVAPNDCFQNTPFTEVLRADHPQSQRDFAMFLPAGFLWRPIGELHESVRTGQPAFPRIFGQSFFAYLASHPGDAAIFNTVMTQGVAWTTPALLAAYDFSRFETLMDVGGGEGALLRDILAATPGLRGVLFDLPGVVAGAPAVLGREAARCQIVGGNFFESVPEGADAYLFKGVIHDWPDEEAAKILRNVRRVIRPGGTLLLIEGIADSAARPAGLMDLLMLTIGGRERTEAEFRALLSGADFAITRILNTDRTSVIECRPAS